MEILNEQEFDTPEEFFRYCSQLAKMNISYETLYSGHYPKFEEGEDGDVETIYQINQRFSIVFGHGGYSLYEIK